MKVAAYALVAMLAGVPSVALAQAAPYKLVISWYQSNLTVIDYPTRDRCLAAARAVNAEVERKQAESDAKAPAGSVRIGTSPNFAFCIPG